MYREQKDNLKKAVAGLFFIASIVLIAVVVFRIGKEKGFTERRFQMSILYHYVGGLTIGAPVTLSGVNVGTVGDITFVEPEIEGRGVKVTLNIYKKYQPQLHKSISFLIKTEGVLGEKIVDITTDPDFYRTDLAELLIGQDPLDVQSLAETFEATAKALMETSKSINVVSQDMRKISATTTRLLNRIEQRLIDGNLFKVF